MPGHVLAERRIRPARPAPSPEWGRLQPTRGCAWVDLLPADAPDGLGVLYALLDAGLVEAWQDGAGHVALRIPHRTDGRSLGDACEDEA